MGPWRRLLLPSRWRWSLAWSTAWPCCSLRAAGWCVRASPAFRPAPARRSSACWAGRLAARQLSSIASGSWKKALESSLNATLLRHFDPSDDECVRLGLPLGWRPEEDQIARNRLGTLAWMVASGLLEVRVALPLDHNGRPYQPGRQGALYHPKAGILYDAQGDIIVFQGSVNETGAAWTRNREKFDVRRSWFSDQDREDIAAEIEEFEEIWRGRDPGLLVKASPAIRQGPSAVLHPA